MPSVNDMVGDSRPFQVPGQDRNYECNLVHLSQAALLPLIAASRDALAAASPELDGGSPVVPGGGGGLRGANATGRFSWKAAPPGVTTGGLSC